MDFDVLMQKYLEGSINSNENTALRGIVGHDPILAERYNSLVYIEGELRQSKTMLNRHDMAFLTGFGRDIYPKIPAAKIPAVSAGKAIFSGGNFLANLISSKLLILTGTSLVIITAGIIGYNNFFKTETGHTSTPLSTVATQGIAEIPVEQEINTLNEKPVTFADVKGGKKSAHFQAQDTLSPKPVSQSEVTATIEEKNVQTNSEVIAQLQDDLDNFEKQNDKYNIALTQKKLGIAFRNSDINQSRSLLTKSLGTAESLNSEFQSEIYGEMAITEFKAGNSAAGAENLAKCLKLLESHNSARLEYWKKVQEKYIK